MTITITTKEWTIKVLDADTLDWTYIVTRGNPTLDDVKSSMHKLHNPSRA